MDKIAQSKLEELKLAEDRLTERDKFFMEEESKSAPLPYSQEVLLQAQRDRQFAPYCEQEQKFDEWYAEDQELLGKNLVSSCFIAGQTRFPSWKISTFNAGRTVVSPSAKILGQWNDLSLQKNETGLELQSKILQCIPPVSLRSLACEIRVKFRLVNDSAIQIFTRGCDVSDPNAAICKVRKQIDSRRVFLSMGSPIGPNQEFKFFKKLEMPEPDFWPDAVIEDYTDINLKVQDNGNDKVMWKGYIAGKNFKAIKISCDKFIPILTQSKVMIAGSGSSVLIRQINIQQVQRDKPLQLGSQFKHECCNLM